MMKILVTGSSGRLGKEIVKLLRQNNYEVLGADLVKSETTDEILDIRNLDSILQITKSIDGIIRILRNVCG